MKGFYKQIFKTMINILILKELDKIQIFFRALIENALQIENLGHLKLNDTIS